MSVIAICEKPSQARNLRDALGGHFDRICEAQGHLYRLQEPAEADPAWGGPWHAQNYPLLWPGRPYGWVEDPGDGKAPRLARLKQALKTAACVYIATDADREGQLIGEVPLRRLGFRGEIRRMLFNDESRSALQAAYKAAVDNRQPRFANWFEAGDARHQADQVLGMTLTRAATVAFATPGARGALGTGRVKTPAVAIAVRRELEIRNSRKTTYFVIEAAVRTLQGGERRFAMLHPAGGEERILDAAAAKALAAAVVGRSGRLSVTTERKSSRPKTFMDQGVIQKLCGSWGWSAKKTADALQYLYQDAHLLTYPGTDGRHLPDDAINDIPAMIAGLKELGFAPIPATPTIRRGKSGHFSTAALDGKPHHAIVPNIKAIGRIDYDPVNAYAALDADQKRLFDYVARHYIAALSPDHLYDATHAALDIALADGRTLTFMAHGRATVQPGWRAAMAAAAGDEEEDADEESGGADAALPALADGEMAAIDGASAAGRETRPPGRYTEGALIEAMHNVWKTLPPGPERDRLQESEGIGRPRTRGPTVQELLAQGQLVKIGKFVAPSEDAIRLIQAYEQIIPELIDPAMTARWEMRFDDIEQGRAGKVEVLAEIVALVDSLRARIKAHAGKIAFRGPPRKPTKPMLDAVNTIAKRKGVQPGREVFRDFDAARAWLDAHGDRRDPADGPRPPSEAQRKLAAALSASTGIVIPESAAKTAKDLGAWIDGAKAKAGPSEKQLALAEKLSAQTGRALSDAERGSGAKLSKAIDEMLRQQRRAGTTGTARRANGGGAAKKRFRKRV